MGERNHLLAVAEAPATPEAETLATPERRMRLSRAAVVKPVAAVAGVFLFVFALQLIKSGARGLVPLLDGLEVSGAANATGFGWLLAYAALSGSPVAAIGITLLAGGVLSEAEAFGVVGGSRLGASFIVLAVGFFLYIRKRRNSDGLYIGVVALLTTFTTQGPALLLGLISLHYGWLDGVRFETPADLLDVMTRQRTAGVLATCCLTGRCLRPALASCSSLHRVRPGAATTGMRRGISSAAPPAPPPAHVPRAA
jgi:hypothetical protein